MKMLSSCAVLPAKKEENMHSDGNGAGSLEKRTYTVREIADLLNVSSKAAYALVKSGQFSYVRIGNAIRISKSSFDQWLDPTSSTEEET